jgi:hypothetical protein
VTPLLGIVVVDWWWCLDPLGTEFLASFLQLNTVSSKEVAVHSVVVVVLSIPTAQRAPDHLKGSRQCMCMHLGCSVSKASYGMEEWNGLDWVWVWVRVRVPSLS